jgi:CheY-like chemotaxis protein
VTVSAVPKVLVVDDSRLIRTLIAEAIGGAGYRVSTAADGEAGLAAALAEPPDLVVTDLHMPALDGAALCQRLMADPRTRAVPVLIVTALPAAEAAVRLAACPPNGLAHKGDGLDGILRAVAALLPPPG